MFCVSKCIGPRVYIEQNQAICISVFWNKILLINLIYIRSRMWTNLGPSDFNFQHVIADHGPKTYYFLNYTMYNYTYKYI